MRRLSAQDYSRPPTQQFARLAWTHHISKLRCSERITPVRNEGSGRVDDHVVVNLPASASGCVPFAPGAQHLRRKRLTGRSARISRLEYTALLALFSYSFVVGQHRRQADLAVQPDGDEYRPAKVYHRSTGTRDPVAAESPPDCWMPCLPRTASRS